MEERQPVLLALIAPATADGFIKRIIARIAAEEFNIARPEKLGGCIAKRNFADRHQGEFLHRLQ